jgi:hypothetical protein
MAVLTIEFLLLFFVGPTLFAYTRHRIPAIPALWAVLAYCLFVLLHNPQFDRRRLWTSEACANTLRLSWAFSQSLS